MSNLLGCRVCLATDNVKLYNIFKYNFVQAYEVLTGIQIFIEDGMPQHICSFCGALLLKCVSFKEKCFTTQQILVNSIGPQEALTTDSLRLINHQFVLPYLQESNYPTLVIEYSEPTIKEEVEEFQDFETDLPKPKKKRKKKIKQELCPIIKLEEDIQEDNYDGINFDSDKDEVAEEGQMNEVLKDVEVVFLNKEDQMKEIEERKTSSNYVNSFYKCDKCYKGYITESTFRNHMLTHDPERGSFLCGVCQSRWPEARSLRAHIINSHERKYVCKLCDHVSRSSHRAREHSNWHNGFKFICKICGASFAKSTSHLTHIRLQHPSNNACEICGESFIGEFGLRMHKRKAHNAFVSTHCAHCETTFRSIDALARHVERSKTEKCDINLRSCSHCGAGYSSETDLKEHLQNHHKDETVNCDECKRSFTNERSYAIHYQRVHLGVKMKQKKPRCLKRPSESVVCEICGKKCITKATLIYHQRIHTGEKPYQCSECPKKFSVFQRLQIHLRTHTGESPYKCKHCPKAFKHKAALNRHDRVHTGAKPYSCSHCGKSFSQSNSMKLHVNTVHLKLPAPYRSRRNKIN